MHGSVSCWSCRSRAQGLMQVATWGMYIDIQTGTLSTASGPRVSWLNYIRIVSKFQSPIESVQPQVWRSQQLSGATPRTFQTVPFKCPGDVQEGGPQFAMHHQATLGPTQVFEQGPGRSGSAPGTGSRVPIRSDPVPGWPQATSDTRARYRALPTYTAATTQTFSGISDFTESTHGKAS